MAHLMLDIHAIFWIHSITRTIANRIETKTNYPAIVFIIPSDVMYVFIVLLYPV